MDKSFFSQNHGCPNCGGMVEFKAKRCGYCRHLVTFADRCQWVWKSAAALCMVAGFLVGSSGGFLLFQIPPHLLPMGMAVVVGFWSTLRSKPVDPRPAYRCYR